MRRLLAGVTGTLVTMVLLAPATAAQTELEPVPGTVLAPPQAGLRAKLSVVVPPGEFPFYWVELQGLTTSHGGPVVSARAESIERDGRTVGFGVAQLRVPPSGFVSVLGEIIDSGTLIEAAIAGSAGGVADMTVRLSESGAVAAEAGGISDEGRVSRALDSAAEVLFTIVGVAIVVAAAVLPLGVLGLVAYAGWRWSQRRLAPTAEMTRPQAAEPDREHADR